MTAKTGVRLLMFISILLVGILYFGNFTQKRKETQPPSVRQTGVSFDTYEEMQIGSIADKELTQELMEAKRRWRNAQKGQETVEAASRLAALWAKAGKPELEAYYLYLSADERNDADALAMVGDRLLTLYRVSDDTLIKNNLITFALRSLEKASGLAPDNLELKVRLGSAYVEGTSEPMKGITLLREVVDKDPNNVEALIMLGRFAILSGQYDRAKERLDKVLMLEPNNPEAIYFMAITQEGLGNIDKAIELLEVCKKIVNNPAFDAEVNGYIEQLKNKK